MEFVCLIIYYGYFNWDYCRCKYKNCRIFGLIETVSTDVTKLLHQAFLSAKDNLEYASTTTGQNQIDYVKRAKDCFIDAVAVEENENKILALVGLSMCQFFLQDYKNAQKSLDRIRDVNLTTAEKVKYKALNALKYHVFIGLFFPIDHDFLRVRESAFMRVKEDAINLNRKMIQ